MGSYIGLLLLKNAIISFKKLISRFLIISLTMSNINEFLFRANDESKNDHRKNIDYVFQSESTLYSFLNFKELLA